VHVQGSQRANQLGECPRGRDPGHRLRTHDAQPLLHPFLDSGDAACMVNPLRGKPHDVNCHRHPMDKIVATAEAGGCDKHVFVMMSYRTFGAALHIGGSRTSQLSRLATHGTCGCPGIRDRV
jgi:hypothetical protein